MKPLKIFFISLVIVILMSGCAGYRGGMEDQTGGGTASDEGEYTDFAAKKAMEATAQEEEARKKAAEQQEQIQPHQDETQGEKPDAEESIK